MNKYHDINNQQFFTQELQKLNASLNNSQNITFNEKKNIFNCCFPKSDIGISLDLVIQFLNKKKDKVNKILDKVVIILQKVKLARNIPLMELRINLDHFCRNQISREEGSFLTATFLKKIVDWIFLRDKSIKNNFSFAFSSLSKNIYGILQILHKQFTKILENCIKWCDGCAQKAESIKEKVKNEILTEEFKNLQKLASNEKSHHKKKIELNCNINSAQAYIPFNEPEFSDPKKEVDDFLMNNKKFFKKWTSEDKSEFEKIVDGFIEEKLKFKKDLKIVLNDLQIKVRKNEGKENGNFSKLWIFSILVFIISFVVIISKNYFKTENCAEYDWKQSCIECLPEFYLYDSECKGKEEFRMSVISGSCDFKKRVDDVIKDVRIKPGVFRPVLQVLFDLEKKYDLRANVTYKDFEINGICNKQKSYNDFFCYDVEYNVTIDWHLFDLPEFDLSLFGDAFSNLGSDSKGNIHLKFEISELNIIQRNKETFEIGNNTVFEKFYWDNEQYIKILKDRFENLGGKAEEMENESINLLNDLFVHCSPNFE